MYRYVILFACACLAGCDGADMTTVWYQEHVEIAPNRWLAVSAADSIPAADLGHAPNPHLLTPDEARKEIRNGGSSSAASARECSALSLQWDGKDVAWAGPAIPVTLREYEGRLYMIGFDRSDLADCRFVLFGLSDQGTSFVEIERTDFPKQIATQNMWLSIKTRYFTVSTPSGSRKVDKWAMLRAIDIENPGFGRSLTAQIWYYLVTGLQYDPARLVPDDFLRSYKADHRPIPLPTIVREALPETK